MDLQSVLFHNDKNTHQLENVIKSKIPFRAAESSIRKDLKFYRDAMTPLTHTLMREKKKHRI